MANFFGPKVYGTVTVGERGQVVIPVNLRKQYGIKSGDKLIVIAKSKGPISFIPASQLDQLLNHMTNMIEKIKAEKTVNK